MAYVVDWKDVSTEGLESSPVAKALAGLRANEARYFKNKYDHTFTVEPASEAAESRKSRGRAEVCHSGCSLPSAITMSVPIDDWCMHESMMPRMMNTVIQRARLASAKRRKESMGAFRIAVRPGKRTRPTKRSQTTGMNSM